MRIDYAILTLQATILSSGGRCCLCITIVPKERLCAGCCEPDIMRERSAKHLVYSGVVLAGLKLFRF